MSRFIQTQTFDHDPSAKADAEVVGQAIEFIQSGQIEKALRVLVQFRDALLSVPVLKAYDPREERRV